MADPDIPITYATAIPMNPGYQVSQSGPNVIVPSVGATPHRPLNESELRTLRDQGFAPGLCQALEKNKSVHVLRVWIVDNSGSMNTNDGHRLVETKNADDVKIVSCTRWTEIQECVIYHAQMAQLLQAPTIFRLLNDPGRSSGPQQFSVAYNPTDTAHDGVGVAIHTMKNSHPVGVTPLAHHIREIRNLIVSMEPELRRNGTKVSIVVATDGLPTDPSGMSGTGPQQDFIHALRSLQGLPVWVVVRLCTDEDDVVEFYNNLDSQLEMSLEVLDDFVAEAKEVHKLNPWLNYALPLHRMREMGIYHRLFDLLDERKLTKDELREFMFWLFGSANFDGVPDPSVNFHDFCHAVEKLQKKEKKQWNPIYKNVGPWINIGKLQHFYHHDSPLCIIL